MAKFVVDADAAIKLAKANVMEKAAEHTKLVISQQVYMEILRGKENLYEDAFCIESLVKDKKIAVRTTSENKLEGLGAGECSALTLFKEIKADAIISDDRKFLSLLEHELVPYIIVTDFIVFLVIKKAVAKEEGLSALDKIRFLIREENYQAAKMKIEGD